MCESYTVRDKTYAALVIERIIIYKQLTYAREFGRGPDPQPPCRRGPKFVDTPGYRRVWGTGGRCPLGVLETPRLSHAVGTRPRLLGHVLV